MNKMATKSPIRIRFYDLTVRAEAIEEDVFPILKELRPEWQRGTLLSEFFNKGFVNNMVCFYHTEDEHRGEAVVVRVYGAAVGDNNPRDREFMNLQIAHAAGCFPDIYASFDNGLIYQYAAGRHTNFHDLVKPENIRTISRLLYRLHHVDIDDVSLVDRKGNPVIYDKTPTLFDQAMGSISSIPDGPKDGGRLTKFKQFRKELSNQILMEEFSFIKSIVDEVHLPVSFSHMDFHPANIIINDKTGDITFIDLEMSCVSYMYFDLASLFLSKTLADPMGMTTPDEPDITPDVRRLYVQSYLEAKREAEGPSGVPEVEAEIFDIKHSIMEIMQSFQFLVLGFAVVDMDINAKFDFLDLTPILKQHYFTGKEKLVALKNRCIELTNQALNPSAE